MLCLRPSLENAVFRDFDPAVHVRRVGYDESLPLYRAIDFGYVNPFVCLWIQVDRQGIVRIIDEYVERCRTIKKHAEEIQKRTPGGEQRVTGTFCDPAGKSPNGVTGTNLMEELRNCGIHAKAAGSRIMDGLEQIRRALRAGDGTSRLVIAPECVRLIEAMQCYHYSEEAWGDRAELPVKDGVYDHPIDALRYFFANTQKKGKIRQIRT